VLKKVNKRFENFYPYFAYWFKFIKDFVNNLKIKKNIKTSIKWTPILPSKRSEIFKRQLKVFYAHLMPILIKLNSFILRSETCTKKILQGRLCLKSKKIKKIGENPFNNKRELLSIILDLYFSNLKQLERH